MQIKKSISILIAFIVLNSNLGLAFNLHYCHEQLASISLLVNQINSDNANEDSCCVVIIEEDSCCSETTLEVSKKVDNLVLDVQKYQFFSVLPNATALHFPTYIATSQKQTYSSFSFEANAPPCYKLYCQYLLYA